MRIADASSDGKKVDMLFGMVRQFLIDEVDGDNVEWTETRSGLPWCGEDAEAAHEDDAIERAASMLSDCDEALVYQIGDCAFDDLMYHANGI